MPQSSLFFAPHSPSLPLSLPLSLSLFPPLCLPWDGLSVVFCVHHSQGLSEEQEDFSLYPASLSPPPTAACHMFPPNPR